MIVRRIRACGRVEDHAAVPAGDGSGRVGLGQRRAAALACREAVVEDRVFGQGKSLTITALAIDPWTPVHSLTWGKAMAWNLGGNMDAEIERVAPIMQAVHQDPQAAKACIGVVPQEIAVYEDLSARENLNFWGRMYGLRGPTLRKRVDEVLVALQRGVERARREQGRRRDAATVGLIGWFMSVTRFEP